MYESKGIAQRRVFFVLVRYLLTYERHIKFSASIKLAGRFLARATDHLLQKGSKGRDRGAAFREYTVFSWKSERIDAAGTMLCELEGRTGARPEAVEKQLRKQTAEVAFLPRERGKNS